MLLHQAGIMIILESLSLPDSKVDHGRDCLKIEDKNEDVALTLHRV